MNLRIVVTAMISLILAACHTCPVGGEGCLCTQGGGCDVGLQCLSKRCVDPNPKLPDGGSSTLPDGGSLLLPDGGMRPADPPGCTSNADCAADEVCSYDTGGTTACLKGTQQACGTGLCAHGMNFDRHVTGGETSMRGHTCTTNEDCPVIDGHLIGVCIDVSDTGAMRACVPLCQFHDDPQRYACASDPRFGLSTGCSRNHARALAVRVLGDYCVDYRTVEARCVGTTATFSPAVEATIACIEASGSASCGSTFIGCTYDPQLRPNLAGLNELLDALDMAISRRTVPIPNGSGGTSSVQCGTDCDCGHCSYCEKSGSSATCRYGGEGPYGCYRGCD